METEMAEQAEANPQEAVAESEQNNSEKPDDETNLEKVGVPNEEQLAEVVKIDSNLNSDIPAQCATADGGNAMEQETATSSTADLSLKTIEEYQTDGTVTSQEPTATVKLQLLPGAEVITVASSLSKNLSDLRDEVAADRRIPAEELHITYQGEALELQQTLKDLNVQPNGTIQFGVMAMHPHWPLKPAKPKKEMGTADFITVRITKANSEVEDVVVEIERQCSKKPFLGGFRHRLSGTHFHHAAAQTPQTTAKPSAVEKFNRNCQAVFECNQSQQTTNVMSTQMPKVGCYILSETDKLVSPREYTTYKDYMKKRIKAVVTLQSYFRRWQARHLVDELKADWDRRVEWERLEEVRKRREKEERIKREFEKRINPNTREDFDLLYAALEKWRLEELSHINDEFAGAERKAALCALLEQETQLIGSIDRRKIGAFKDGKEKKILNFLDKAAAPKRWKAYDGRFTEMDTQYTIRAKELRDIYNSINMKYLIQDERLDVLLTLKHTVKEHDCKLTREITELIDREADLLMRGVRDTNLEGLRKRILTLFLQYCKNPLFNPEVARLLKVPQDPSTLTRDIYFCPSANQYLPSTEFKLTSNSTVVGKCRKVQQLDNEARTRQDFSHYRIMLRDLRQVEENYHDNSKIAYLIQEKDLQYLVENIWGLQSILSSWDNLYDLVFIRWDKDEEWSPWNTILLTKDEAMAHGRLDHLEEAYSRQFVSKVCHKHTLARVHFVKLPGMAEVLRKKTTGSQRLPGPGQVHGVNVLNV